MIQKSKETLVREFEEAKTALEAGPEPGAEKKKKLRTIARNIARVLVCLIAVMGLLVVVVWNVEPLRIVFFNFYLDLVYPAGNPPIISDSQNRGENSFPECLLPDDYQLIYYNEIGSSWIAKFSDPDSEATITFRVTSENTIYNLDTENATTKPVQISDLSGVYIEKVLHNDKTSLSVFLFSEETGKYYNVSAYDMDEQELWGIITNLAQYIRDCYIPTNTGG